MAKNSRDSQQAIKTIKQGILGYYKSPDIMRLKKSNFTETDDKQVEILSDHFQNVYNRKVTIDWAVLQEFKKNLF